MQVSEGESVTGLLLRWRGGDRTCLDRLVTLLENDMRRIARHQMQRERPGHILQTTALVNEAYLKLVDIERVDWRNRAEFLAMVAHLIRQILVDHARMSHRQKRGGGDPLLPLDGGLVLSSARSNALVSLDDALRDLAVFDPRKAQVVELRYFGGLTMEEAADALGLHRNTVLREWSLAKSWLRRELRAKSTNGS